MVQAIQDQTLLVGGGNLNLDLEPVFSDANGDALTYSATSSDDQVVGVLVSGSQLTVVPLSVGSAMVTVRAEDGQGGSVETRFEVNIPSGVGVESGDVPSAFVLRTSYPNPFIQNTTIGYDLPTSAQVQLTVFDMLGRPVAGGSDDARRAASGSLGRF